MTDEITPAEPRGLDRRQVLKRVGAGTALAWAAPAVLQVQVAHADGSPPPARACTAAVLSGDAENAAATIGVDDDVTVWVNGTVVFSENDNFAQDTPPIALGAVANGDTIRVAANDSIYFGANRQINPIYLHCLTTGAVQVLDAVGYHDPGPNPPSDDVFYDRTFTVAL